MSMNIPNRSSDHASNPPRVGTSVRSQLESFTSSSPLANYSIARDLEEEEDNDGGAVEEDQESPGALTPSQYTLSEQYRRPSAVAYGSRPLFVPTGDPDHVRLSKSERQNVLSEERSLLRDNNFIPPKHPRERSSEDNLASRLSRQLSLSGLRRSKSKPDEETGIDNRIAEADGESTPTESTALLGDDRPYGGQADSAEDVDKKWEEAVLTGKIQTTWQREAKVLAKYSRSLILTFLLQYSLTMASIFTVGHIGKVELGAVSLASSIPLEKP